MELIEKRVLSTAQTDVSFTGPWAQYMDLEIYINAFFTTSGAPDGIWLQFNNDTASNYSVYWFESTRGTSINSSGSANFGGMWTTYRPSGTTAMPVSCRVRAFDINRTDTVKHMVSRFGGGHEGYTGTYNGAWKDTSSISSLKLVKGAGASQFLAGTTVSVYGVRG
jgi:hypothetical protein